MIVRDLFLWHRGMPNHSNRCRHMINMIHNAHRKQRGTPLRFHIGCGAAFENDDLDPNVEFVERLTNATDAKLV